MPNDTISRVLRYAIVGIVLAAVGCASPDPDLRSMPLFYDAAHVEAGVRFTGCERTGQCAAISSDAGNLAKRGEYDKAIHAYSSLLDQELCVSCRCQCLRKRAASYIEMREFDKAIADLNDVLLMDKDDSAALLHRYQVNRAIGRQADADADWELGRSRKYKLFMQPYAGIGEGGVI